MTDDLPITQWYCEKGCGAILNGESREFHKCKGEPKKEYGIEAFEKQIANLEAPETAPALPWKLEFYQGGSGHTCAACKIWSYPLYALGILSDKFVLYLCINCKDEVIKAVEEYKETNDR